MYNVKIKALIFKSEIKRKNMSNCLSSCFSACFGKKNKVAPNRYAATHINPFKSFNKEVGKIIPGFSLTQEQFESESITICLFKKKLSSQKLSEFYNYVLHLELLKK